MCRSYPTKMLLVVRASGCVLPELVEVRGVAGGVAEISKEAVRPSV